MEKLLFDLLMRISGLHDERTKQQKERELIVWQGDVKPLYQLKIWVHSQIVQEI